MRSKDSLQQRPWLLAAVILGLLSPALGYAADATSVDSGAALQTGISGSQVFPNGDGFTPDSKLLLVKGYSPTLIHTIGQQRNRQEWRTSTTPRVSTAEQVWRNIYHNDWTGAVDEFGQQQLKPY